MLVQNNREMHTKIEEVSEITKKVLLRLKEPKDRESMGNIEGPNEETQTLAK
jgi:hypothetical protein